jgi:hypothetical protein
MLKATNLRFTKGQIEHIIIKVYEHMSYKKNFDAEHQVGRRSFQEVTKMSIVVRMLFGCLLGKIMKGHVYLLYYFLVV